MQELHFKVGRKTFIIFTVIFTFLSDQITKILAREILAMKDSYYFFNHTLLIKYVENPGAFLSLGANLSETARFWIFSVSVTVFLAVTLYIVLFNKKLDQWSIVALAFISGGGLGNLLDRVTRSSVTDFINLGIGDIRTGIFNFADMYITFGAIIFFILQIIEMRNASKLKKNK